VLVREDQLSLAIGRRGQNVRLASKLCGWDIEIMTREELDESIERAVGGFSSLTGVDDTLAEKLVGEGFLSYDDLSIIEPDSLMEMGELTEDQANEIVTQAEAKAQEAEQAAAIERRRQREQDRVDAATAAAEAAEKVLLDAQAAAEGATAAEITGTAENHSPASSEQHGSEEVGGEISGEEHPHDHVAGDGVGETVPDDAGHATHAVPKDEA
jgi:transcription termination/antitermination protein NusA